MAGFTCTSAAGFALASGGKTSINLISGADSPPKIVEFSVSCDALTALAMVLVEMCASTQGAAGTSTGGTINQIRGYPAYTPRSTCQINYTGEPTTLTVIKEWWFRPDAGPLIIQSPLAREVAGIPTAATAMKGIAIRVSTSSGTPNCRSYMEWEEG